MPASFNFSRIGPRINAEDKAPARMAYCCNRGVEPTKKPVFKSCEVVPALLQEIQTIAPTESAVT